MPGRPFFMTAGVIHTSSAPAARSRSAAWARAPGSCRRCWSRARSSRSSGLASDRSSAISVSLSGAGAGSTARGLLRGRRDRCPARVGLVLARRARGRVDDRHPQDVRPVEQGPANRRRAPRRWCAPGGHSPTESAKWRSRAAPVGVVSSPTGRSAPAGSSCTAPPQQHGHRRRRHGQLAVGGVHRRRRRGRRGHDDAVRSRDGAARAAAAIRSTAVSRPPSSCRWSSPVGRGPRAPPPPCAAPRRRRRRPRPVDLGSRTCRPRSSSSNVAKPGRVGDAERERLEPAAGARCRSVTSRGSMPAAFERRADDASSGPCLPGRAPAQSSSAAPACRR